MKLLSKEHIGAKVKKTYSRRPTAILEAAADRLKLLTETVSQKVSTIIALHNPMAFTD